jgi:hypothetical protein
MSALRGQLERDKAERSPTAMAAIPSRQIAHVPRLIVGELVDMSERSVAPLHVVTSGPLCAAQVDVA